MTAQEQLALAMLRGGLSFEDAAKQSKLSVEEVMALWKREKAKAPRHA